MDTYHSIPIESESSPEYTTTIRKGSCKGGNNPSKVVKAFRYFDVTEEEDQRYPFFTILLSLGIGIAFAVEFSKSVDSFSDYMPVDDLVKYGGMLYPNEAVYEHKYWQFFTYIFVHNSVLHVFSNLFSTLFFGCYLEIKYKWYRVATIFFIGGIASSLFWAFCRYYYNESASVVIVGCSGASYTLVGGFIGESYLNWETIEYKKIRIGIVLLLFINQIIEYTLVDESVAVTAHIGGLIYGMSPAILYLPNYKFEGYEALLLGIAVVMNIIYFIVFPIILFS